MHQKPFSIINVLWPWPFDPETYRAHPRLMGSLCMRFMLHNCLPLTPIIMKLNTNTPLESRKCPMDFRVKGQGHNAMITENGLYCKIAFPFHLSSWNYFQWIKHCDLDLLTPNPIRYILDSWGVFVWSLMTIGVKGKKLCDINHFH